MSRQQIEEIVESLQNLPETSQQQVREFIAGLRSPLQNVAEDAALPESLGWDRGLLVYTGSVLVGEIEKFEREHQLNNLIRRAIG
jgi:hypothetical protein